MDSSKHNLPRDDGGSSRIRSWSVVVGLAVAAMSIVSSLLAPPARAQTPTITGFPAFLAGLWPAAEARGITRATFDEAFKGLEPDLTLPELVLPGKDGGERKSQQAEFVRSPAEYLNPKTLANLTATGRDLAHKWSADLARIEQQYGVPRSIVLAIWGRETAFGTYKPPHDASGQSPPRPTSAVAGTSSATS